MKFETRVKVRLGMGAALALFGVILICISSGGGEITAFGAAFAALGVLRIIKYARLLKNKENLSKSRIAEEDERNVMVMLKARSAAFSISILAAGIYVIYSYLAKCGHPVFVSFGISAVILIYLVCYYIEERKI